MTPFPTGSLITIDTVILIFALERHPEVGPTANQILERIQSGDLKAFGSTLIFAEFLPAVFSRFDAATVRAMKTALSALKIAYLPVPEKKSPPKRLGCARLTISARRTRSMQQPRSMRVPGSS